MRNKTDANFWSYIKGCYLFVCPNCFRFVNINNKMTLILIQFNVISVKPFYCLACTMFYLATTFSTLNHTCMTVE